MHSAPGSLSPRQKIAVVRDPDMLTSTSEVRPYKTYPFHGLQQSPTKGPGKRLKHIGKKSHATAAIGDPWYPLGRPFTPLSSVSPASVVSHLAHEPHPPVKPTDLDQVEGWLKSLEAEAQHFTSYFLFCEMKFQQTAVLASGKDVPNRLRTAVAFYCLQQASSIFGRYQSVLDTICLNLGAAIYTQFSGLRRGNPLTALECYQAGVTYFEQCRTLQAQNQELKQSPFLYRVMRSEVGLGNVETEATIIRLQQQLAQLETQNQLLRQRTSVVSAYGRPHALSDAVTHEHVGLVVNTFQGLEKNDQLQLIVGLVEHLGSDIHTDALLMMIDNLPPHARQQLIDQLFQEHAQDLRAKAEAEAAIEEVRRRHEDDDRLRALHEKYQSLILDVLNGTPVASLDVPLADRETMEALGRVVDALGREKDRVAKLEARIFALNVTRSKAHKTIESSANTRCAELEATIAALEAEKRELHDTCTKLEDQARRCSTTDVATQVNKAELRQSLLQPEKERSIVTSAATPATWLQVGQGPKVQKRFAGLYTMIQDANYSVSSVKRILSKKRPLSLVEMHVTIAGLYQSKLCQDIADDNMHRHRDGLSQMLLDAYTVYYGLKELAMGQLIHLDTAVRRFASKSSRIRLFGLLVGSLEPGSFASSAQAIDFFLFVVGVLFNIGNYRLNADKAMANVKQLKAWFGDGVPGSANCATLKMDKLVQTVHVVFAYNHVTPAFLDELSSLQTASGDVDLDLALEKIMFYWLTLYGQQIETMRAVFGLADKDGNGVLDFQEFSLVVHHLDPECHRRDVLALYNRVAGADNVIDIHEFVVGMILHQRDLMLQSYFAAPSAKPPPSPPLLDAASDKKVMSKTDTTQLAFNVSHRLSTLVDQMQSREASDSLLASVADDDDEKSAEERLVEEKAVQWDAHIDDVVSQFMGHVEARPSTHGRGTVS
ncbi:hypothetical protein SDRG_11554 [Saprolegnia diclina VS20]|uniref:EF-hand domain-containing protein n=1 Tax=Saprolegnia diclina (strain VS20) TaxID=1156394 RepID=T0RET1_SAPDV|nr:hypothetical protein SDRG_11554 [Saprolegnia diclina VS20]EQC30793.1 hypothetical protein SDRG_11554 [Saprolegnia diclina VS20]|eukprot:XP_008615817.1 hypothetical protein SDRG_11554 [Saprolegnia diclina VS20]